MAQSLILRPFNGKFATIAHHQLSPLRPEMKVLYMSGYTDEAIVHHEVLEEGTAFIGKPFSINALTRKLREILDAPVAVWKVRITAAQSLQVSHRIQPDPVASLF